MLDPVTTTFWLFTIACTSDCPKKYNIITNPNMNGATREECIEKAQLTLKVGGDKGSWTIYCDPATRTVTVAQPPSQ